MSRRILFEVAAPLEYAHRETRPGLHKIPLNGLYAYSAILQPVLLVVVVMSASTWETLATPLSLGYALLVAPIPFCSWGKTITIDDDFAEVRIERGFLRWRKEIRIRRGDIKRIEVSATPFETPRIIVHRISLGQRIGILTPGTPTQVLERARMIGRQVGAPVEVTKTAGTTPLGLLRRAIRTVARIAIFVYLYSEVVNHGVSWKPVVIGLAAFALSRLLLGSPNSRDDDLPFDNAVA